MRSDANKGANANLELLAPLGAGGFGSVYEARDRRSGERVAVKQLDDLSADSIARFKQEFRVAADCHHPNLVSLKELIAQDGRWLIVMELVPGTDLLNYVRRADNDNDKSAPLYDEARLRSALIGLVEGLRALHGFGLVHRDLKPSNVRVRPDGRPVLLDFGLATSIDPKRQSTHAAGVGTAVYMAPEQSGGTSIGPAADMYALGVCLYEALTGRAPFEGTNAIKILLDKQRLPAPRACSLAPSVPRDLDELCARLLAIEPSERPTAEEVLSLLNSAPALRASMPMQASPYEPSFAGRESELEHLIRALSLTHEGEQRVVLIEGESGIGKSELVSEFLRQACESDPKLIALRGRCYENEQVSYKAFDGCIDELAKILRRMPEAATRALLPERAALLGQLFPVLRNVQAIVKAPREGSSADPTARRLEAFAALSQLLANLAEERPLVLVLDDLQWADAESFRLLSALKEQSTRAPVLFLITVRPRDELEGEVQTRVEELRNWSHTNVITLFGLPREQAKGLAARLLGGQVLEPLLMSIASESQGHPLFISELVQYTQSHDFLSRSKLTIEAALRARVEALPKLARELLEIAALAARPYPANVLASALGEQSLDEVARTLLATKLLRKRRGHELGCYHDRIRHAAVSLIARTRLPVLHHKIAAALATQPDADPSEQARHWDLAGQPERACLAYEQAGTAALNALAFASAAELFERALALVGREGSERWLALTTQRADALAWAGRSANAATLYQAAAGHAQGETRIRLRSRAAAHLMMSANAAEGFAAARGLLTELGFSLPVRTGAALLRYAWESLRLRVAGLIRSRVQKPSERDKIALAAYGEMISPMSMSDPLAYVLLSAQAERLVLRVGSQAEAAMALARRGLRLALRGRLQKASALLEGVKRMADALQNPVDTARAYYLTGSAYLAGWKADLARADLTHAQELAQEHCKTSPWFLTMIRFHLGTVWYLLGEHKLLAQETERWLAEARERNDFMALGVIAGMGSGYLRHIMADRPDDAIAEIESYLGELPGEPFSFVHLGQAMATISLAYKGGSAGLRYIEAYELKHGRPFLLRAGVGAETLASVRASSLMHALRVATEHERGRLMRELKASLRVLSSSRADYTRGLALLLGAQLHALDGRRSQALLDVREASNLFRGIGHFAQFMALYLEGLLEGESGREKQKAALAGFEERGWVNPLRAVATTVPFHDVLAKRQSSAARASLGLLCDRYEVTDQLGSGGFGSVVSARDTHTGRQVALKELVRSGGGSLERFKREFRALADLHHENIVQLEELFEHDGRWYIAMELVEGVDFVSYVRASGAVEEKRLREAALGLTRALGALHQKGFVHRDVKPKNVLVTKDGRAVLLDFGLLARIGDEHECGAVGSLDSAAPEQLRGAVPQRAADVYGLGASIHEALSGAPPKAGATAAELLHGKGAEPSLLRVPPALAEVALITKLMLAANPDARPTLDEVARVLAGNAEATRDSDSNARSRVGHEESGEELVFAGRSEERAQLKRALARAREEGLTIALIEGESGMGKSALAREFTARARGQSGQLLVLTSRCYENEQVAFKAFDGAVDQLARFLRELPSASCEPLLPKRAALLAQLFPVLSSVPAIAGAPKKGLPADPITRRQMGLECFVQLLRNVASERALLIAIDDLQWADADSFSLLTSLAREGAELPALFIATVRPTQELEGEAVGALHALRALPCTSVVKLAPLDEDALSELGSQLLGADTDPARLAWLVRESKGHPLFLRELIQHDQSGASDSQGDRTLDAVLRARIAALPSEARDLLNMVALGDKPHEQHVYARALAQKELARDVVIKLLSSGLLRRRGDNLACYHDRIRRVSVEALAPAELAATARKLAAALRESPNSATHDAAERARLWEQAGVADDAIAAYEQAGDQALEALAFMRAEQHYERALSLIAEHTGHARWLALMTARGNALVRAGRSAEAARVFQRAAVHAEGDAKVKLRVWSAQHLIQGAHVAEGMAEATELLSGFGLVLPQSDGEAKRRIVWERARLAVRGTRLRARSSAQDTAVLEALYGLISPVRVASFLSGSALIVQYSRRALDSGEPRHAALGLACEALWQSLVSGRGTQDQLFDSSAELAVRSQDPALIAEVEMLRGISLMTNYRNADAAASLMRAHDLLVSQCPGQPWLLTSVRMYLGSTWMLTCNFQAIAKHGEEWIEEAKSRDDLYAFAALSGFGAASLRHALRGDPEQGLRELQRAAEPWPEEPFSTVQMGLFFSTNMILRCMDDGPRFAQEIERRQAVLARAYLMRTSGPRGVWFDLGAFAQLKCIRSASAPDTEAILNRLRAFQNGRKRVRGLLTPATEQYYEACRRLLEGKAEEALAGLRVADATYGRFGYPYTRGIQYLMGAVEGGESGRALCAKVEAEIRAEGWKNFHQGLAYRVPFNLELLHQLTGKP